MAKKRMIFRKIPSIKNKKCIEVEKYCGHNINKYLQESTLHGLKFLADRSLTIWERIFFFCSFVAAFITVVHLISNIYAKWNSTPVIIGINPHPTSIINLPFPAVTICNMNQVLASKIVNFTEDSYEGVVLKLLCLPELQFYDELQNQSAFLKNDIKISEFVKKYSQPCSKMLLYCEMGSVPFNCTSYFHEIITDEGICCVFNVLHPTYLYNINNNITEEFSRNDDRTPVDWSPEEGYQKNLPNNYYPIPALGTGVSLGLSVIVNSELDEYYCSTSNGPGFKIALHNPANTPQMKESGLTVPLGFITRFRIEPLVSEAVPNLRSISTNNRQCLYTNEKELLYYSFYTRENCEFECLADYILNACLCIPYNLPLIYSNASVCTIKETFCISNAKKTWANDLTNTCRSSCLPGCFSLSYESTASTMRLIRRNYIVPSELIRNMSKVYVNDNFAVIHFYYGESLFYANLKNVYIGFTEFLSNTGGIMGLFMGFSFISLAEIFYFSFLRPWFELYKFHKKEKIMDNPRSSYKEINKIWLGDEIFNPHRQHKTNLSVYKPSITKIVQK